LKRLIISNNIISCIASVLDLPNLKILGITDLPEEADVSYLTDCLKQDCEIEY